MQLNSAEFHLFRNNDTARLRFYDGMNLIYGDNGAGKTNVLEALYLCCTGRSHRTRQDRELIRWGADFAAVRVEALRRDGWTVRKADNRVLEGIRRTAQALQKGEIVICKGCDAAAREFSMYCWDLKSGQDKVVKEHDHAMDEIRYFVMAMDTEPPLAATTVERRRF